MVFDSTQNHATFELSMLLCWWIVLCLCFELLLLLFYVLNCLSCYYVFDKNAYMLCSHAYFGVGWSNGPIVVACVVIHNFLRKTIVSDSFFEQFEHEVILQDNQSMESENWSAKEVKKQIRTRQSDQQFIINIPDQIANDLHYCRS